MAMTGQIDAGSAPVCKKPVVNMLRLACHMFVP